MSILLVVAFHAGLVGAEGGFVGVDVFFVLSGYLITSLLLVEHARRGRVSIAEFVARRVRRLLPLAALVILTTVLLGLWLVAPVQRRLLALDAVAASLYVANWRSAAQTTAYTDVQVTDGLLLHYWSLSVEEQFYLVWPLLVVGVAWVARRWSISFTGMLVVVLAAVVTVSFAMSVWMTAPLGPAAYYVTHLRVWELGAGALLALSVQRVRGVPRRVADVLGVVGLLAIVGSAWRYGPETAFPGVAALVPVLGTVAVLVAGAGAGSWVSDLLSRRPLPALGRLSYAWYLWHWPAIGLSLLFVERRGWSVSPGAVTLVAVVASLGLAVVSHVMVEQPVRRAAWAQARRPALAMGAGMTLMPVVAVLVLVGVVDTGDRPVAVPGSAGPGSVVAGAPDRDPAGPDPGPVADPGPDGDAGPDRDPAPDPEGDPAPDPGPVADPEPTPGRPGTGDEPPAVPELGERPRSMTPAEAADDRVTLGRGECHSGGVDVVNVGVACVFGDIDGAVTVALVGDSHAQHWLPAFDVAGRSAGWRVLAWSKSACPFVDVTVWDPRADGPSWGCDRWYAEVLDRLGAEAPVDVVLLGRAAGYEQRVIGPDGDRLEGAEADDAWQRAAAATFGALDQVAGRVVVLRDTPWIRHDVPSCLSEQPDEPERCAFDLDASVGLDERLERAERAAADASVVFVDLNDLVCPDQPCQVVTPTGTITHRDFHHLTATFSAMLGPDVAERLAPIVAEALRAR